MCEQVRVPANTAGHPLLGPTAMTAKTFHLARGPPCEPPVDHPQGGIQSRLVESSAIVDPPPDRGVEHSGQVHQALVAASMQVPTPDFRPNGLGRRVADARTETHEVTAPSVLRPSGPKRVGQKVKRYDRVGSSPIAVLTVEFTSRFRKPA